MKKQEDHPFSADTIDEQIDSINKSITSHALLNDAAVSPTQQPDEQITMQESYWLLPNQRLIDGLQSLYEPGVDRQIGERAWQRLQQYISSNVSSSRPASNVLTPSRLSDTDNKGIITLHNTVMLSVSDTPYAMHVAPRRHYASLLIATVIALCIAGSLLWVLHFLFYNTNTGATHIDTLPTGIAQPQVGSPKGVYVGGMDGVYRLDVKTGVSLWHYTPPNNPSASPAYQRGLTSKPLVDGKYVYVTAETGILYALDAETGKPVWTHDFGQHSLEIMTVQDDSSTLYIQVGDEPNIVDDYIYTLNSKDGMVKTWFQLDIRGGATIIQNKLYIKDTHNLYVHDLLTQKQIWQASVDQTQTLAYTTPQVVNGVVYLTSSSVKTPKRSAHYELHELHLRF